MSSLKKFTGNSSPCFIVWNPEILNYIGNSVGTIKGNIFSHHSHLTCGICFCRVRWIPRVLAGVREELSRSQTFLQMISKVIIKATKASSGVIPVYHSWIQPLLVGFGKGFVSRDVFLLLPTGGFCVPACDADPWQKQNARREEELVWPNTKQFLYFYFKCQVLNMPTVTLNSREGAARLEGWLEGDASSVLTPVAACAGGLWKGAKNPLP